MVSYLLVHGAYHGSWCWDKLVPLLKKEGSVVFAPDLPGSGKDTTLRSNITLNTYVSFLSELIESNDLKDLVLVGHSMGASIVAKIAEKFPSRINRVIFIAGTLIDGECIFDVIPKSRKSTYLNDSKKSKDNSVPVNSALVRSHFLNGCDEDIISFALKNLTPQAIGTYATKIKLNTFKQLETPSTYIICDNDLVVPKEMTQKYISRLTKKSEVLHLNSNHEPMLEKPKELAKMIKEITQRKFEV